MTDTDGGLLTDYLTEAQLARELRKVPRTLQRWRRKRTGPPVTTLGRVPYYRKEGVRNWLLAREVHPDRDRSRKRA